MTDKLKVPKRNIEIVSGQKQKKKVVSVMCYHEKYIMSKIFLTIFFVALLSFGCCFIDPMTRAQDLSQKGKFKEAVKILESEHKKQPNSVPVQSLLAQAYSDYGLALCQDADKPPKEKYPLAKEQFAMALTLNPYLKDAKEMYDTIQKIQESFESNKLNE